MAFRVMVWGVAEFAKQYITPTCQYRFPTPNDRRELEHRLTLIALLADKHWSKLSTVDRAIVDLIFGMTLGIGTREAWVRLKGRANSVGGHPMLLRAHDLERIPDAAIKLQRALDWLSCNRLNGQFPKNSEDAEFVLSLLESISRQFDSIYRPTNPPDKDITTGEALDKLLAKVNATAQLLKARAEYRKRHVVLGGPSDPVIVQGKEKKRLTLAQFDVVRACVEAGEQGLSKDELIRKSKHEDAVNVLKRLAKSDPDWNEAIRLAGAPGGRYRIRGKTHTSPHT